MKPRTTALFGALAVGLAGVSWGDVPYVDVADDVTAAMPLSLTNVWDKADVASVAVAYSTVGWDRIAREADDSTVVISLEPVDGSAAATTLQSGLTGRSTWPWTPAGLETKTYRLRHVVVCAGVTNQAETLEALFSFANNPFMRVDDATVIAAIKGAVTLPFSIVNDAQHPWVPVSKSAPEGVLAPAGVSSTFDVVVDGAGVLSFDVVRSGGAASVSVDGGTAQALASGEVSLSESGRGRHVVRFSVELGASESFKLLNVRWIEQTTDFAAGESASAKIDLSDVWNKTDADPVAVAYSAVGWDRAERAADGSTVILLLEPANGSQSPTTLQSGLTGRSAWSWALAGLETTVYRLSHFVVREGVTNEAETLQAFFDFTDNPYMRIDDAKVTAAMSAETTLPFSIVNDEQHPWIPVSMSAPMGIKAPANASSSFDIVVDGSGALTFDYVLTGGAVLTSLDGATAETLATGEDSVSVSIPGRGRHVFRFLATLGAEDALTVLNVRWVETDVAYAKTRSALVCYDLRTGVRMPKRYQELLPFVYSPTNFTGCVGADETSFARVSVVQVTGDEEAGIESWTNAENEVAGTLKVLKASASVEGAVEWTGATRAIWKATFEIRTGGDTVYTENAFFDLRKYHPIGTLVIIR